MNPGDPDIKAIFAAALERPAGPDRAAYLDAACGADPALRRRLDDLLAAHERADAVLGPPPGLAGDELTEASVPAGGTTGLEPTALGPATGTGRDAPDSPSALAGARMLRAALLDSTTDGGGNGADDGDGDGLPRGTAVRYLGDYEIRRELGHGGMGVVYEARQMSLNRLVALKMVKAGLLAGDAELNRFRNEAEAVALLDHPGIVPIFEVGAHEGQHFFSMKLVPGGSLVPLLRRYPGDPKAAARLVAEAAEAVAHAHARGVLHRDLKPANILVDADGHPYLTDFGLAKRLADDSDLTQTGAVLGTPSYMAPEQAAGRRAAVTTGTDLYGLGAVLYALLTGKAPFVGDSVVDTLTKVKSEPPVPPRKLNPAVPRDLEIICLKCLEKDPRRRYPTAQALADDLRAWLDSRPIAARPARALERATLFVRRKPLLASTYALASAVLLLAGVGGTIAWFWREAEAARQQAVVARDGEQGQRLAAERARERAVAARRGEEQQRRTAEQAREQAERAREQLAVVEYGRTIQVAYQEWRENNLKSTRALLDRTRPNMRGWEWHYVNHLCNPELLSVGRGFSYVWSASFSPDGSRVVTAGSEPTARVWDAATGAELIALKGHTRSVLSASYSRDGSRVVTASEDGTARVWDAATGAERAVLKGHAAYVLSASFSPDGSRVVTASRDGTARVWDAATGAERIVLRRYKDAAGVGVRVIGGVLGVLKGHTDGVWSASFSPDGSRIVTANGDGTARVWDAATGAVRVALKGHTDGVTSASYSPDGSRIVTASRDGTARVWDAATGAERVALKGHSGSVSSATYSPDGSRIVTASEDRTARVWDAATGAGLATLKGHTDTLDWASFSPDGSRIVTSSRDGTARVWDVATDAERRVLKGPTRWVTSASFSPDGSRVVAANLDGTTRAWDAATGAVTTVLKGHIGSVTSAAYSPDGSRIVTAGRDRTARVWDATTGAVRVALKGHTDGVTSASYSPDGSRIVTASEDRTARVWDAATGAERIVLKGHTDTVTSATFSPDGSRIVTAGEDGTSRVWDAATGAERLLVRDGQSRWVMSASYSPDGSRIVTANRDDMARVWDAATGDVRLVLKGHTDGVWSASFSPDGSRVVTASLDDTTRVWDAATGAELIALKGHSGSVLSASYSPDGSRVVTASEDGTACIWDSRPYARARRAVATPSR